MLPEDQRGTTLLLKSGTGCVGIPDLNWPILCLRTFAVVTADEVPDELQLSATNVSESNPGPLFLVYPDHNTGHVYSQLSTGKPERQPDGGVR